METSKPPFIIDELRFEESDAASLDLNRLIPNQLAYHNSPAQILDEPHLSLSPQSHTRQRSNATREYEHGTNIPTNPPTKLRKRKAPTLHADAWEPYKARILQLHDVEKLPLREVKRMIESEFGFIAELRQYRTRISQWGADKNVKKDEMKAIVRKQQRRKILERKGGLVFRVRGRIVEQEKITRFMKRNSVSESLLYSPSLAASTPSAVSARTISELASSIGSPALSVKRAHFTPSVSKSIAHSSTTSSSNSSLSDTPRDESTTFEGQSPEPVDRSATHSSADRVSALGYAHSIPQSSENFQQYRYRQIDENHLREKLSKEKTLNGLVHPETLNTLYDLGFVLTHQGRYQSAEAITRMLVEGCQKLVGDSHYTTLCALQLLGQIFVAQGLYTPAEKLYSRIFESRQTTLGDEDPSTLSIMSSLMVLYNKQGRTDESEKIGAQVVKGQKKVLGEKDPSTLTSMNQLAMVHTRQGRLKDAEEALLYVRDTRNTSFGGRHPDTLTSLGNLAIVYHLQNRWKEAEAILVDVVLIQKEVFGDRHPDTLAGVSNLAIVLKHQGNIDKAAQLIDACVVMQRDILGSQHPATLISSRALVSWHLDKE